MKLSEGFTKPVFTVSSLFWYGASFCFLSMTLKSLPVGAAYAVWSGLGSVLTPPVGYFLFAQKGPVASIVDMVMIVAGVGVMLLSSAHWKRTPLRTPNK